MTTEALAEPKQDHTQEPDQGAVTHGKLWQFSGWVHVGPGAENCPELHFSEAGIPQAECANPLHFHAWCHLPNQFQHDDLRDVGTAAAARRRRELRDPETNAHARLEDEMEELARYGDRAKPEIIRELIARDERREMQTAVQDTLDIDDPDQSGVEDAEEPRKLYANVLEDEDRLIELSDKPEDERGDEYKTLVKHLQRYNAECQRRHKELLDPIRGALESKDISELVDLLREERIRTVASLSSGDAYKQAMWVACTLRRPGGAQLWSDPSELRKIAPEVYAAVRLQFDELEGAALEITQGNG